MAIACSAESAWINFAPRMVKFLDTLKSFDIGATVRQISRKGNGKPTIQKQRCRLFGRWFWDTRWNEAHVPSIRIALINSNDAATHFMRPATCGGDGDRELDKAITTVALDMHFHDFNRMAPGTGGEAVGVIRPKGFPATHDRARGRD